MVLKVMLVLRNYLSFIPYVSLLRLLNVFCLDKVFLDKNSLYFLRDIWNKPVNASHLATCSVIDYKLGVTIYTGIALCFHFQEHIGRSMCLSVYILKYMDTNFLKGT